MYLPSPLDIPPVHGEDPKDASVKLERKADDAEPLAALAFKIASDPFVGRLAFVRVYSGVLQSGSYVLNSSVGRKTNLRLVRMHANKREEIKEVFAGDIAAAVGLKDTTTGDTLCDLEKSVLLERIIFPEPVISIAIEPKTKVDQEKMGMALGQLAAEDPTFRIKMDEEVMQTIISGMGELHLEVLVDRLRREFGVEANVGKPQVAYKETIKSAGDGEGRYIRQSGGRGQYGHCYIHVEPLVESEQNFEFVNQVKGGRIPQEYIPAIEKGIKETLPSGVLAGYPMMKLKVTVTDGSYHEVDSSEAAFKIAGSMGLKAAVRNASPILLEPVMHVEVVTPRILWEMLL